MNTDNDRWVHVLQGLNPNYFRLKDIMENGSRIVGKLTRSRKKSLCYWTLTLEEKWQSIDDAGNYYLSSELDKVVAWAEEELKKWKCRRTSWNMWEFQSKREAEKFITFYNLTWSPE